MENGSGPSPSRARPRSSGFTVGIDVGGTFTDLVATEISTGRTVLIKTPSTPRSPGDGVLTAVSRLLEETRGAIDLVVHASTVGTNLFLGQTGLEIPRGALVTTTGFRDVLEIGRQKRSELYNPFFERSRPLIPRRLRFTLDERMDCRGKAVKKPDPQQVADLADVLAEEGVETVAVVFLHSYANPEHEQLVCSLLNSYLPGRVIVASSRVDCEYREYERTSTTVVNSLLVPVVSRYLGELADELKKMSVDSPLYVMQSNGGLASVATAVDIPAATIESGPATGVIAAAHLSRLLGYERVLSFDMGGTTAKAGAVIGGAPQMVSEYEVGGAVHSGRAVKGSGYPVRYPFIDLAEVSGGGGTIAWLEDGSALRVGPVSAGADPGPACYGTGGENPTVTDANLVLGRLNPGGLSGGEVSVYPHLAEQSIKNRIASPLGLTAVQAASGICDIVNQHMMRALRLVSIERGFDPRQFVMVAFGGCGPMHAPFLAEGLSIPTVIVPPSSGVFSAFGLILADFRHDLVRSVMKPAGLLRQGEQLLEGLFADLQREAEGTLAREGFSPEQTAFEQFLDLRYIGQSFELTVPFTGRIAGSEKRFHNRHQEIYGYASGTEPVEVVNVRLVARGLTGKPKPQFQTESGQGTTSLPFPVTSPPHDALLGNRKVYFKQTGWAGTPVYRREALVPGNRLAGPAIIEQYDATTVVPPGWDAETDPSHNLRLTAEHLLQKQVNSEPLTGRINGRRSARPQTKGPKTDGKKK